MHTKQRARTSLSGHLASKFSPGCLQRRALRPCAAKVATKVRKVTPKRAQVPLQGHPWAPKSDEKCTFGTQNVQGTPPKALGVPTQAQNVPGIILNRQNGREFASNQKQKFGEGYRVAQGKKDQWTLYFIYLLGSFCCSGCGEHANAPLLLKH